MNDQPVTVLNGVDPITGVTKEGATAAYGYPVVNAGSTPGAGYGSGVQNAARKNDDNPNATNGSNRQTTQQVLTQTFNGIIRTQQNQLDQYASYTYALSWYLLTPQQYTDFQAGVKNSSQWSLLMHSLRVRKRIFFQ